MPESQTGNAENGAGPFCIAAEPSSDALCHKEPGHDGPHNGWAHFPGQMVTWTTRVLPPAKPAPNQRPEAGQ